LGISTNRINEWQRIWSAAKFPPLQTAEVLELIMPASSTAPLGALVTALQNAGWDGKAVACTRRYSLPGSNPRPSNRPHKIDHLPQKVSSEETENGMTINSVSVFGDDFLKKEALSPNQYAHAFLDESWFLSCKDGGNSSVSVSGGSSASDCGDSCCANSIFDDKLVSPPIFDDEQIMLLLKTEDYV
jgi:hypothetical protein